MTRHHIRNNRVAIATAVLVTHLAFGAAPGSADDRAGIRAALASTPVSPQAQADVVGRELTRRAVAAMPVLPIIVPRLSLHRAAARPIAQERS